MSDLEHIAIERLKAASEMSFHAYGLPGQMNIDDFLEEEEEDEYRSII